MKRTYSDKDADDVINIDDDEIPSKKSKQLKNLYKYELIKSYKRNIDHPKDYIAKHNLNNGTPYIRTSVNIDSQQFSPIPSTSNDYNIIHLNDQRLDKIIENLSNTYNYEHVINDENSKNKSRVNIGLKRANMNNPQTVVDYIDLTNINIKNDSFTQEMRYRKKNNNNRHSIKEEPIEVIEFDNTIYDGNIAPPLCIAKHKQKEQNRKKTERKRLPNINKPNQTKINPPQIRNPKPCNASEILTSINQKLLRRFQESYYVNKRTSSLHQEPSGVHQVPPEGHQKSSSDRDTSIAYLTPTMVQQESPRSIPEQKSKIMQVPSRIQHTLSNVQHKPLRSVHLENPRVHQESSRDYQEPSKIQRDTTVVHPKLTRIHKEPFKINHNSDSDIYPMPSRMTLEPTRVQEKTSRAQQIYHSAHQEPHSIRHDLLRFCENQEQSRILRESSNVHPKTTTNHLHPTRAHQKAPRIVPNHESNIYQVPSIINHESSIIPEEPSRDYEELSIVHQESARLQQKTSSLHQVPSRIKPEPESNIIQKSSLIPHELSNSQQITSGTHQEPPRANNINMQSRNVSSDLPSSSIYTTNPSEHMQNNSINNYLHRILSLLQDALMNQNKISININPQFSDLTNGSIDPGTTSMNIKNLFKIVICPETTYDPKPSESDRAKQASTSLNNNNELNNSRNSKSCPICMDTLKTKKIAITTCGHIFCMPCIQKSLTSSSKKCPTCRKKLTNIGYQLAYINDFIK